MANTFNVKLGPKRTQQTRQILWYDDLLKQMKVFNCHSIQLKTSYHKLAELQDGTIVNVKYAIQRFKQHNPDTILRDKQIQTFLQDNGVLNQVARLYPIQVNQNNGVTTFRQIKRIVDNINSYEDLVSIQNVSDKGLMIEINEDYTQDASNIVDKISYTLKKHNVEYTIH